MVGSKKVKIFHTDSNGPVDEQINNFLNEGNRAFVELQTIGSAVWNGYVNTHVFCKEYVLVYTE